MVDATERIDLVRKWLLLLSNSIENMIVTCCNPQNMMGASIVSDKSINVLKMVKTYYNLIKPEGPASHRLAIRQVL